MESKTYTIEDFRRWGKQGGKSKSTKKLLALERQRDITGRFKGKGQGNGRNFYGRPDKKTTGKRQAGESIPKGNEIIPPPKE